MPNKKQSPTRCENVSKYINRKRSQMKSKCREINRKSMLLCGEARCVEREERDLDKGEGNVRTMGEKKIVNCLLFSALYN